MNSNTCWQSVRARECATRWLLLSTACGVLSGIVGCQVFTREAGLQRVREDLAKEQALKDAQANEDLRRKLELEHAELDKKYRRIEKRNALLQKRHEAQAALQEGQASKAAEILGSIFKELKDYEQSPEAMSALPEDSILIEPREQAKFRADEGIALFQSGKKDEAIAALRLALELDRDYSHARRTLAKMLLMTEKLPESLAVYQEELARGSREAELLFPVGQVLFILGQKENDNGKIEAARVALQNVLVERPTDPEVRRWLARLEYDTGRFEEAARLFEALRRENPLQSEYLEYLANCHVKLKDYVSAVRYLELMTRVSRANVETCRTLGDLYAAQNMPGRAAEWHARANANDPKQARPEDRLSIGQLFQEARRNEEAIRWLEAVEAGDKELADAQSLLAQLYHELGRTAEALAAFEKAGMARPEDGFAFLSMGDIHRERKDYDRAAAAYARASGLPGTNAEGYFGLGELLHDQGKLEEAEKQYQKAAQARPDVVRYESVVRQIEEEIQIRRSNSGGGVGEG